MLRLKEFAHSKNTNGPNVEASQKYEASLNDVKMASENSMWGMEIWIWLEISIWMHWR